MPKSSKESTLKVKIQARALYEMGKYTQEEICEAIKKNGGSLSRKTLIKWISEDADDIWQIREYGENRIYDAQKIVQKEKILQKFKKEDEQIKDDIITRKAKEDATVEANILLNLERERNKLTKEMLESAYAVNKYIMDLIKKGQTAKFIEEDIVFEGIKTGEKKYTKEIEEHTIPQVAKANEMLVKMLYGLGVLQSTPAIAIQQNNDNTKKVVFVDKKENAEIEDHILETINDK